MNGGKTPFVLLATVILYAAEGAIPAEYALVKMLTEAGAVGALGLIVFWLLIKTLPAMTRAWSEDRKATFAKLDQWEKQRHADSALLNETLAELRIHCAKRMQGEK